MRLLLVYIAAAFLGGIILFSGFYVYWNNAKPEHTCASCHEITPSVGTFRNSAHRDLRCFDCHGTALENGAHSLKEKAYMVYSHATGHKQHDEIRMTEAQVLEVSERCAKCHQSEYKNWQSGKHSASYKNIFLDSAHNSMERLYWDCFRCHGMYYEGNIYDLVTPISIRGPWRMKDQNKVDQPVIPCLTCHQVHTENIPLSAFRQERDSLPGDYDNPVFGLYLRSDRMFLRADFLPVPKMYADGKPLETSKDPFQALCVQCHAPGAFHVAGSSDDRIPKGVHAGLSCKACHEPHSNNARSSCDLCHPAISNCKLDVKIMNTSFYNLQSPNDIHFVSCGNCHDPGFLAKTGRDENGKKINLIGNN